MVDVVFVATATVVTGNVTDVAPLGTVTDVCTDALAELEFKDTTVPVDPAGPLSVTVPVDDVPPTTEVGVSETLLSVAGVIVKVAVWLDVP